MIMNEIRLVSANNYGNGGLSFIDRQIYRYLLIPFTKKALLEQEKQFTWMDRYVSNGQPKPDWGPGRDDAMNLTKYFMTSMKEDNSVGPTDFPSIWNLGIRSGKDNAGKQMLLELDWRHAGRALGSDRLGARSRRAAAAVVSPAHGRSRSLSQQSAAARLALYRNEPDQPANSPPKARRFTPAIARHAMSRAANLRTKWSRSPRSEPTRNELYSWSKAAAEEANRRVKEMGIDRPPMAEARSLRLCFAAARRHLAARTLSAQRLGPDIARSAQSA